MSDPSPISRRLAGLKAELAAARPQQMAAEVAQGMSDAAANAADVASAQTASELELTQAWIRAHPLTAVGGCLIAGVLVSGLAGGLSGVWRAGAKWSARQ